MPLLTIFQLYQSVLLVEKTGVNHRTDKLYHIMLYRVRFAMSRCRTHKLVEIGTDCIRSCKSNYHTITTIWRLPNMQWNIYAVFHVAAFIRMHDFSLERTVRQWGNTKWNTYNVFIKLLHIFALMMLYWTKQSDNEGIQSWIYLPFVKLLHIFAWITLLWTKQSYNEGIQSWIYLPFVKLLYIFAWITLLWNEQSDNEGIQSQTHS